MQKWKVARLAALPGSMALLAGQAYAAVPADVTTAVEGMKDDGIAIATAVLVAIIAVLAIKFLRKGF